MWAKEIKGVLEYQQIRIRVYIYIYCLNAKCLRVITIMVFMGTGALGHTHVF